MSTVRIAAAQTLEFREDMDAALRCATGFALRAAAERASLLCFPECFLQGYLTDEHSARRNALHLGSPEFQTVLDRFPKFGPMIVMGMIEVDGAQLFNSAVVMKHGILVGRYRKTHLLSSEQIFSAGSDSPIFEVDRLRFGINICYDTNFPETPRKIADLGGVMVVCPSNNMMRRDKAKAFKMVHNIVRGERCRETGLWLVSADVTGERDGSVACGPTAVLNPDGQVVVQLPLEEPGLLVFDIPLAG
jgi:predicted amidohydrolase